MELLVKPSWGAAARVIVATAALSLSCADDRTPTAPDARPLASAVPPTPGTYVAVASETWTGFVSKLDPVFTRYWSYGASGGTNPPPVMTFVDLVPDPLYGQVARITQPGGTSLSPQLAKSFTAMGKTWLRFRIKFSPGWTARGSTGPSYGHAWKVMHLYMPGGGRTRIEVENATQFGCGFAYPNRRYIIAYLPGSRAGCAGNTQLGGDKFLDGEWYEWIVYHEATGPLTGRLRYWERRLTRLGAYEPGAWWFKGTTITGATSTDLFPPAYQLRLGVNKNRDTPSTQYVYWGPWELVDGSRFPDPFDVGP